MGAVKTLTVTVTCPSAGKAGGVDHIEVTTLTLHPAQGGYICQEQTIRKPGAHGKGVDTTMSQVWRPKDLGLTWYERERKNWERIEASNAMVEVLR